MTNLYTIENFMYCNSFVKFLDRTGSEITLYVDAYDIIDMLLGLKTLSEDGISIDLYKYSKRTTLIYSLIYGGWLKNINLTIPYQNELHENLKININFVDEPSRNNVEEFLCYFEKKIEKHNDSAGSQSLQEYVRVVQANAQDFYKANYFLRDLVWRQRLKHLVDNDILRFDLPDEDLSLLFKSDIFRTLMKSYEIIRPGQIKNNTVDSIVLTAIQNRLTKFLNKEIYSIPLLYDSKGSFQRVIQKANLESRFSITYGDETISIICSNEFVTFLALYQNEVKIYDSLDQKGYEDLVKYRPVLDFIFNRNKSDLKFIDNYNKDIEDFMQSRFMELCWINSKEAIHGSIKEYIDSIKSIEISEKAREEIRNEMDMVIDKLRKDIAIYSVFQHVYEKMISIIERSTEFFTSNFEKYDESISDILDLQIDMSLMIFSAPTEVNNIVKDLFKSILSTRADSRKQTTDVVHLIIDGICKEESHYLNASLIFFGLLGEYKSVVLIMNTLAGKYNHLSEGILHAISIVNTTQTNKGFENALEVLNNLRKQSELGNDYNYDIVESYLWFQKWLNHCNDDFLRTLGEPSKSRHADINNLFQKSINLINKYVKYYDSNWLFDNNDKQKRLNYYYALNNFIYYITMGGTNSDFLSLNDFVAEFVNLRGSQWWQCLYDYTLALFHLRKAIVAEHDLHKQLFELHITQAKKNICWSLEGVIISNEKHHYEHLYCIIQEKLLQNDF